MIIAYPFGDTKTVEVHVRKPGIITEKMVKEMFAKNKQIKFVSITEKPQKGETASQTSN